MRMQPVLRSVLGCGLAWLLRRKPWPGPPMEPKLPEGPRHVPLDALGFVHVRVGDFLRSAIAQDLLKELNKDREASKGLKKIEETLGVEVANLESVTLLILAPPPGKPMPPRGGGGFPGDPGPGRFPPEERKVPFEREPFKDKDFPREKFEEKKGATSSPVSFVAFEQPIPDDDMNQSMDFQAMSGPLFIVTSTKPLERKKILQQQVMPARDGDFGGRDQAPSVVFLSDRSVILGEPAELARYAELMARNRGPKSRPMEKALASSPPSRT